ncbi:DUF6132 family protein [Thermoflavifilum thermophilum]|uniref:Uncharacterized protein n=1 Tax=Thermoflavifilum thermophilum TaxID=1393122 RepID=A0A1I7NGZ4_9BACT|nr:DUF6132 family protein [Thermoflavifilum thermophilum]SFV33918.1 hypothetical protein SAMN05660895_1851 [Thermoflavifilum thermophilum]
MKKSSVFLFTIGAIIGAIAGYAYYHFIGCTSGYCVITSHPVNSTLYGAMMGGIASQLFQREDK